MGSMRIYVAQGPNGQAGFRVEEYKRPKFQVVLEAPKTASKLNEKVSLSGHATSYTGAAIDGARIHYRVVRDVRWPYWWGWYSMRQPQVQPAQEIAHGTTTTESDGSFKLEFLAKPDPKVSEKDEASFSFTVHADVTEQAGVHPFLALGGAHKGLPGHVAGVEHDLAESALITTGNTAFVGAIQNRS